MANSLSSHDLAKLLLRGRFAQVQDIRQRRANEYRGLPDGLRQLADAWTGRGRGDAAGRRQLQRLLREQT